MKIEAKQINEWVQKAYKNAVKHGWHEEEKTNAHWLIMACTEVSEAVQADRKGRYMNDLDKEGLNAVLTKEDAKKSFNKYYTDTLKGKVESELADICIRLFDFMGVRSIEINSDIYTFDEEILYLKQQSFTENAMLVTRNIITCNIAVTTNDMLCILLQSVIASIFSWAEALEIDLVQHINLKMRYNESRSYRHGNRRY